MSTAAPMSQAATLLSTGRGPTQMPLDAEQAQELRAIWKSIFERTRLIEAAPPAPPQKQEPQYALQLAGPAASVDVLRNTSEPRSHATSETAPLQPANVESSNPGSMSAESINVFVQGAAVSIVVRDTAISEHEAVRCAFETAQKLTGQRATLQQLTLNGRTLYQQLSDPGAHDLPSLVFAC